MELQHIQCKCGKSFIESELEKHIENCCDFKREFKEFDKILGELLTNYSKKNKDNLIFMRVMLKIKIAVLEKKIAHQVNIVTKEKQKNTNKNIINDIQPQVPVNLFPINPLDPHNSLNLKKMNKNDKIYINKPLNDYNGIKEYNNVNCFETEACQKCACSDIIYLECCHPICKNCFNDDAEKDFDNMKCKCGEIIKEDYKKIILGDKKYKKYKELKL